MSYGTSDKMGIVALVISLVVVGYNLDMLLNDFTFNNLGLLIGYGFGSFLLSAFILSFLEVAISSLSENWEGTNANKLSVISGVLGAGIAFYLSFPIAWGLSDEFYLNILSLIFLVFISYMLFSSISRILIFLFLIISFILTLSIAFYYDNDYLIMLFPFFFLFLLLFSSFISDKFELNNKFEMFLDKHINKNVK